MKEIKKYSPYKDILVYDIESLRLPDETPRGFDDPFGMGLGTGVVYSYKHDLYWFFGPEEKEDMILTLTDTLVVSFNGVHFDNRVLLGDREVPWTDYDIFLKMINVKWDCDSLAEAIEKHGRRSVFMGGMKLDTVAQKTLMCKGKNGSGALAPHLIRQNKWKEVFEYNLQDVRLTKRLYDFIQEYGYVIEGSGTQLKVGEK